MFDVWLIPITRRFTAKKSVKEFKLPTSSDDATHSEMATNCSILMVGGVDVGVGKVE